MTPQRMAERGIEVHVLPSTSTSTTSLRSAPDGVFLSNGPGDPATADDAVALTAECSAASAGLRHLLRQPGPRPRSRPRHLQARLRPPWHQPAGAGPRDRPGRDHRAQPRLRRRRAVDGASVDTPFGAAEVSHVNLNDDVVEGCALLDVPAFSVQYHPEAAAGPHDAAYLFDRFVDVMLTHATGGRLMPKRDGHQQRPGHRVRPDRHRPGLRVRLLRHPGLPGAARGGAAGSSSSTPTRRRS